MSVSLDGLPRGAVSSLRVVSSGKEFKFVNFFLVCFALRLSFWREHRKRALFFRLFFVACCVALRIVLCSVFFF